MIPTMQGLGPGRREPAERDAVPAGEQREHDDRADALDDERREGRSPDRPTVSSSGDREREVRRREARLRDREQRRAAAREEVLREDGVGGREQHGCSEERQRRDARRKAGAEPGGQDPGREDHERQSEQDRDTRRGADARGHERALARMLAAPLELALERQEELRPRRRDAGREPEQARRDAVQRDLPWRRGSIPITITSAEKTTLPAMWPRNANHEKPSSPLTRSRDRSERARSAARELAPDEEQRDTRGAGPVRDERDRGQHRAACCAA